MDTIMTLEEVAEYLRVSVRTAKDWVSSGELPGGKLGGSWRFRRGDIDTWVERQLTPHKHAVPSTTQYSLDTLVDPRRVLILEKCISKFEALNALIDVGCDIPGVANRNELAEAIFAREKLMSTGIGLNSAVPHARLNGVSGVHTVIGICQEGLEDYESFDSQPVKIIVMFVAGRNEHTEYVKALSLFSGELKIPLLRERLIHAKDGNEVYSILTEA